MSGIPDCIDRDEYPFQQHIFQSQVGKISYIDEGNGPAIVFLHGNPTWSFLYRGIIKILSKNFRCIAPDYLGFGLSDSPENYSYTPEEHSAVITDFIKSLYVDKIGLVLHDWGGPIGLKYAVENSSHINRIVLFNTWMWPTNLSPKFWVFSKVLGSGGILPLYYRMNIFGKYIMPLGFSHPWKFPREIHKHYLRPLESRESRYATWMFPRALLRSGALLGYLWENRDLLNEIPKLLVWGMKDRMLDHKQLGIWMGTFPDAKRLPVHNAGHYVPEELETRQIEAIGQFFEYV